MPECSACRTSPCKRHPDCMMERGDELHDAVGSELHVLHRIATRLERAAEPAPFVQIAGRPLGVLAQEARAAHVAIDAAHRAYLEGARS